FTFRFFLELANRYLEHRSILRIPYNSLDYDVLTVNILFVIVRLCISHVSFLLSGHSLATSPFPVVIS
ncbi:MAG: hypothetical protein R6W90_17725, partial [Ignavibacteriaceae bacterium]